MLKEETWSISIDRARDFFRQQQSVTEEGSGVFRYESCRIELSELKPKGMGMWAAKRIRLKMEGEDGDVSAIYHKFFMQFLSTGG